MVREKFECLTSGRNGATSFKEDSELVKHRLNTEEDHVGESKAAER